MQLGASVRETHFPNLAGLAYLDTATQGVPSAGVIAGLNQAMEVWSRGVADHTQWEQAGETARTLVARMLGAVPADVALLPSHVAAAGFIARRFPAARVIVPAAEYRSNLLPWLAGRPAEKVRLVPSPATTDRLCEVLDEEEADLVAVSSIQSADGLRVDLARLVRQAHARGTRVYVDASQSLGFDTTLAKCGADFVGAVGYKWLLGARGVAYLYVNPDLQQTLEPLLPSPQSVQGVEAGVYYGADYDPWPDSRRFDQPPAWLCWVTAANAARLLTDIGGSTLEEHALALARHFRSGLDDLGYTQWLSPVDRPSPIVSIQHPEPQVAVRALAEQGVQAAARHGALRFAFYLFNDFSDVQRALGALHDFTEPNLPARSLR